MSEIKHNTLEVLHRLRNQVAATINMIETDSPLIVESPVPNIWDEIRKKEDCDFVIGDFGIKVIKK